jgi:hypothetical protein
MSAPNRSAKESWNLSVGLLAAKSTAALEQLLGDGAISPSERLVLAQAEKFVESLASGARVVIAGESIGGRATRSVQKLREVLSPIEEARKLSQDKDVERMLTAMAVALNRLATDQNQAHGDQAMIELSRDFFSRLYSASLTTIQQNRRRVARTRNNSSAALAGA